MARFERRWNDYLQVFTRGTSPLVGLGEPKLVDVTADVEVAFEGGVEEADAVLTRAWAKDANSWPRRLRKPFLHGFSRRALDAFSGLVEKGCQPDMLALQFYKATQADEHSADQDCIRVDLEELERLAAQALGAVSALANRRKDLDESLAKRELRVFYGEPKDAELQMLKVDLEELINEHRADDLRLKQRIDGRRQPLLGHAEVRLSFQVHQATGGYHDRDVEDVLGELRERCELPYREHGYLKKRRARWTRLISGQQREKK